MLKPGSYMFDNTRPVVIAGGDGHVIAENKAARRVLGPGIGQYCWDVVGALEAAEQLPCREGCVLELLALGMDCSQHSRFEHGGKSERLSCVPVNGVVVCMLSTKNCASSRLLDALSPREKEILLLLADGETTASAADQLGVSEATVRTHVERMRSKLCVNTRAAAVAEGFRLGYLD